MFLNTVFRKNFKFSSIVFLTLTLVAASLSFGVSDAGSVEKRSKENLAPFAAGLKSIISGAYFSPAATFIVNSTGDSVDATPGDGICADSAANCTLRAAIQESNASSGTDLITFALTTTPATIQLSSALSPAELTINEAVTITGPGARLLTVSGNSSTTGGIFKISSTVTTQTSISGITIANSGGHGVNNEGRLSLSDVSTKTNRIGINNSGRLNINRATVSGNTGGGIYLAATSIVNISNATVTGNSTSTSGGGIHSLSADVTLNNVTISHNMAATSGGGVYYNNAVSGVNVRNTIIAANSAPVGPDIFSANTATNANFVSRGNNLIGKSAANMGFTNTTNGDKVGTLTIAIDPLLGPLQNNGGATDTRALATESAAIDAGNICVISLGCGTNNPVSALSADQRGTDFPRIFDGNNDNTAAVDIGAFESFYPVASISSFVPNNWGTGRGAFELVINGTNFVADSKVKWNGINKVTTFVSNTQIKAQITASDTATAGQFPVIVTNPSPGGGASEAVNFTVANCSYSINPTNQTFTIAGGSGSFNVTAVNGCAWTAVTNGSPWLTLTGNGTGTGNGAVAFTVAANSGPARNATITVNGQVFTVTQTSGCNYSISPTGANNVSAAGVTGSFSLMTSNNACLWAASSNVPWITVTNQTGSGSGTINYTVAANTGPMRNGTITVNGEIFNVTQASGCSYALSSPGANFGAAAAGGNFNVTAGTGCTWTATSSASWVTINSGASGNGNGAVLFMVQANTGPSRTATITVDTKTYTITQAEGCTYTLSATSANNVAAAGAVINVTVTASNNTCSWTTTANVPWITINSGSPGTGSGTVQFTVAANTGPARTGTLTIAGTTYTVNQASGCTFTLSLPDASFDAAGGTGSFSVTSNNPGCTWTATTTSSWIRVISGTPGTGNGTVSYTVQANVSPRRVGVITVNGIDFIITQANGCSYSLPATPSQTISAAGGTGSFTVNTGAACPWTVASNASWITITSSANNTSSGMVNFTVAANNGPLRIGTITAGGKTYTITQDNGCTFTLSPASSDVVAAGGSITVAVTASNIGCTWTSTVSSGAASWITINGNAGGTGDGSVRLTIAANTGPLRTGIVTIANRTFTVIQANGCVYSLSPTGLNINENGGNRSFNIVTGTGCTWTVASNATWITITSAASGTSSGTINFTVAANTGAERNGTITAGGQIFTVNQVNLIVSNLNNDGAGSLRRAVANANASPGDDVVTFQPLLIGTITLTSGEIIIDGGNGALEIKGPGADVLKVSGNNASRIFYTNNSNVTISDLTMTAGNGVGIGSTETAKFGGAIFVNGGSLALVRVNVFRNVITVPASPTSRSIGGGIYYQDGTNYLIQNSSISNNSAATGAGLFNQGELTIINSTIALNVSSSEGGGIYTVGLINLLNSTITRNSCVGTDKGAGIIMWGGVLNIGNTIVAGNTGPEISYISGSIASAGNNLIGDIAGDSANTTNLIRYLPTDVLDTQPMISALENYGGKTFTAALLPGSPAIDAGGSSANSPATDQRGSPRIVGERMDIGAFEQNITLTPIGSSLADGTINASYSQKIGANRFGSVNSTEEFRYSVIEGFLPEGVEISHGNGIIQGRPTSGGNFAFTVRAMGDDGMAGVNKYTISVGCSYVINPAALQVGVGGASGIITLTTSPNCQWTAVTNVPWITVSNSAASGTGNSEIPFTVAANSNAARTGIITVGGKTFTITQAAGCAYSLSSSSASVPHTNGTSTFNINTGSGCQWTTTSNDPWITVSGAANGTGAAAVTVNIAANTGAARTGTLTVGGQTFTVNQAATPPAPIGPVRFDYDGDRRSDISVYRPSTGIWHLLKSQAGYAGVQFGNPGDKLVPADYDGDGRTDLALFREDVNAPSSAYFHIMNSSDNTVRAVQFGSTGDSPTAVGDWDGDGKADIAVYRPGTQANPQGYFYYRPSAQPDVNLISYPWGSPGDKSAVADFDGDGKTDPSIFRPSTGEWFIQRSRDGFYAIQFGASEDKPVVGDYDGDGKADQAVFRPSNGVWYIWRSSAGFAAAQFGISTDQPTPGDYDGDGQTDIAVYRDGNWFILNSRDGFASLGFGVSTDKPAPNSFVP